MQLVAGPISCRSGCCEMTTMPDLNFGMAAAGSATSARLRDQAGHRRDPVCSAPAPERRPGPGPPSRGERDKVSISAGLRLPLLAVTEARTNGATTATGAAFLIRISSAPHEQAGTRGAALPVDAVAVMGRAERITCGVGGPAISAAVGWRDWLRRPAMCDTDVERPTQGSIRRPGADARATKTEAGIARVVGTKCARELILK